MNTTTSMNTTMVRENQELVDEAYDHLNESTAALIMGTTFAKSQEDTEDYLRRYGLNIDRAIKAASKGLSTLLKLQYIRDAEVTVNLSLSDDANGMAQSASPVLASESPVIRSLPVTEHIVPIVWGHQPLQSVSAAS